VWNLYAPPMNDELKEKLQALDTDALQARLSALRRYL
jgi:hypothetical protein